MKVKELLEQIAIAIDLLPTYEEQRTTNEPDNMACDIAECKRYLQMLQAQLNEQSTTD